MFNVVHFEIPADDVERAKKFYGELLAGRLRNLPVPLPWSTGKLDQRRKGEMGCWAAG